MGIPTFIVGTGRCGSTMLSNILRQHPKILSLSEFFGFIDDPSESLSWHEAAPVDGNRFWALLAATNPFSDFAYRHEIPCSEMLYRIDRATAQFSSQSGVPGILVTALPHLTDDPDALFDALHKEIGDWPTARLDVHFHRLFAWLTKHFGKELWIERTGTSMARAGRLLALFPDARFIHLARDGRDTALSMREHNLFRAGYVLSMFKGMLGFYPHASMDRADVDRVPEELRCFLPQQFDREAFLSFRVPLPLCVENWQHQLSIGKEAFDQLPAERLLTLRYEDFFIDPKQQLDNLTEFLGTEFKDEVWSARCAATVRKPHSTWRDLPENEASALTETCRPGFELLRTMGVDYEV